MGLRDKYAYAIEMAKDVRMQGSADEREGKLYFHGTTSTQTEANKIWDAIKTIPDWPKEIVADIKATGAQAAATSGTAQPTTYTVKAGDTQQDRQRTARRRQCIPGDFQRQQGSTQ